jgi:YHS domain-containing protein
MALRLLILVLLVVGVAWVLMRRAQSVPRGAGGGTVRPLVQDPVCKTFVPKETAVVVRRGDVDHYFCSRECAERFEGADTETGSARSHE